MRPGPNTTRLLAGIALIAVILFGQTVYGAATAPSRLDSTLRDANAPMTVIVVLGFTPERFHTERLSSYGVFAGRDKSVNRIRLRNVTPENLTALANLAWVTRIEAGKP